jgi:hypothetical protein
MSGSPSGIFKTVSNPTGTFGCGVRSGANDRKIKNFPIWTCTGWSHCNSSLCCSTMIIALVCTDISGKYITPDEVSQISGWENCGNRILTKNEMGSIINSASSHFKAEVVTGLDQNKVDTVLSKNGRVCFCQGELKSTTGQYYWSGSGHWLAIYKKDSNGNYYCYDGGGGGTHGQADARAKLPISFSAIKTACANRSGQAIYVTPASGSGANLSGGGSVKSGSSSSGSSDSDGGSYTVSSGESASYYTDISADQQSLIKEQIDAMIAAGAEEGIDMKVEGDSLVVDYSSHLKDYVKYANVRLLKGLQYHPNSLGRFNFKQDYIVLIRKKLYFAATMSSEENYLRLYQINNFSALTIKTAVSGEGTCSISLKGGERVTCINKNDEEDKNWQSYEELLNGLTNIDDEAETGEYKWRMGDSDWDSPSSLGVDYKSLMKAREAKYGWRIAEKCDWQPMDEIIIYSQSRTTRNSSGQFKFKKIFFGYIDSIKKQFDSQGPNITIQATDQLKLLKNSFVNKSPSYQPGRFNDGYLDVSFASSKLGLLKITEPFQAIFSNDEVSDEALEMIKTISTFSEVFSGLFPDLIIANCCLAAGIPGEYLLKRIEPVKVIPYIFKIKDSVNYQTTEFESRLNYCQNIAEVCFMEFFQDEEGNIVFKIPSYVLGANNLTSNNMGYELDVQTLRDNNFADFDKSYAISLERIQETLVYCVVGVYTCAGNETLRAISTALYDTDLYAPEIKYLNVGTCQGYGVNDVLQAGMKLLIVKYDAKDPNARSEYLKAIADVRVTSYATSLYNEQSGITEQDNFSGITMSMMTDNLIPDTSPNEIISFTLSDEDKEIYNSIDICGQTFMGLYEADDKTMIRRTVPEFESMMRFGVRVAPAVNSPLIYTEQAAEMFGHCLLAKSAAGRYTATVTMVENPDIKVGNPIRLFTYDEHPNMETGIWDTDSYPSQSVYYINSISRSIKVQGVSTMTLDLVAGRMMGEESIYDKLFVVYATYYTEPELTDEMKSYAESIYSKSWSDIQSSYSSTNVDVNNSDSDSDSDEVQGSGSFTGSSAKHGESVSIPSGMGDVFSYMGWQCITSPSSAQYKLRAAAGQNFDSDGFGKIDKCYVVAMTTLYGTVGDFVDCTLSNGKVIHCIIGDIKSSGDAGINKYGHQNGHCVLEFIVDKNTWYSTSSGGKASSMHGGITTTCRKEWAGARVTKVKNIKAYNKS